MCHIGRLSSTAIGGAVIVFLASACNVSERIDKSRTLAEEMAAIQTMKTLQSAQVQYFSQYGNYAKTLSQLGPATNGPSSAQAADLIPPDLAGGVKGGYTFTLEGDGQKYVIQARPVSYGKTGNRSFYSDTSLVVHQNNDDAPASPESPEMR